mgnify:CR=1 FL=1
MSSKDKNTEQSGNADASSSDAHQHGAAERATNYAVDYDELIKLHIQAMKPYHEHPDWGEPLPDQVEAAAQKFREHIIKLEAHVSDFQTTSAKQMYLLGQVIFAEVSKAHQRIDLLQNKHNQHTAIIENNQTVTENNIKAFSLQQARNKQDMKQEIDSLQATIGIHQEDELPNLRTGYELSLIHI